MKERIIMRRKEEQVKDVKGQGVPCLSVRGASATLMTLIGGSDGDQYLSIYV